jgi:hypothetical protein
MGMARKALFGALATVLLTAVAFALPAGSALAGAGGSDSPVATQAKKKCKKGFVRKKGRCRKKGAVPVTQGAAYSDGRYSGSFSEGGQIYFSVGGGRMYTEGRDAFALNASCSDGSTDYTPISPVQATISSGRFAQSGSYTPGFGQVIPWSISGQIAGGSVSNGVFTVGPYQDFYGNTCSATGHFSATLCQVASACVFVPVYPIIYYQRDAEG